MKFRLAAAAALVLAAAPVSVLAGGWSVDPAKSSLRFIGSQGGSSFDGQFGRWRATIDFDPAHPTTGHATVLIDMASATTGDVQKDQAMPQTDWFDTKSFPEARFEAASFRTVGAGRYEAVGSLTIRGVSKPVVLPFTFEQQGGLAHARGTLELVRTDFGVGQGAWASGQMVGLTVAVSFDLEANRQP